MNDGAFDDAGRMNTDDPDDATASAEAILADCIEGRGSLDEAAGAIEALIEGRPEDGRQWLLRARLLEAQGKRAAAQQACLRAIALWPDITPAWRLLSDLAGAPGVDDAPIRTELERARRGLLAQQPQDAVLANQLASQLCAQGRFEAALPYLREAACVLGHRDSALWNYTLSLAVTGHYHELVGIEPLLQSFAKDVEGPFGPYVHLASAKLALGSDRASLLRDAATPERWLDATQVAEHLATAIAERRPFSLIEMAHAHARLFAYGSLENHLRLSPAELSAVVNSVWTGAFGETIETHGVVAAGQMARGLQAALREADILCLPGPSALATDDEHFGFFGGMHEAGFSRPAQSCAGLGVTRGLHEQMPFLRPLLADQPFLGIVGSFPDLAGRLARFCQIAETATYLLPAALDRHDIKPALRGQGHYPALFHQTMATLRVPHQGAVFLVAAGLLGPLYCNQIRQRGGIAIDIDSLVTTWLPT